MAIVNAAKYDSQRVACSLWLWYSRIMHFFRLSTTKTSHISHL